MNPAMDPVESLPRIERLLLRVSKERGLRPFIAAVTGVSIALSVSISVVAMMLTGARGVEVAATVAIAIGVPGVVAPAAAAVMGRLLLALDMASTELRHLSRTDALTGVLNRRAFADDAGELLRARRDGEAAIVAMIDVDDFKGVNDRHGHPTGDAVLAHLAHSLGLAAGRGVVGRFGGDEFAVVQIVDAGEVAGARQAIDAACDLDAVLPGLRASNGVIVVDGQVSLGLAEAMTRADHALYRVKRQRPSHPMDRVAP